MEHLLKERLIHKFIIQLKEDEKAEATIEKYVRDVRAFYGYVGENKNVNKATMIAYKDYLSTKYAVASVNRCWRP